MFDLERAKREGAQTENGWPVRILGERDHHDHPIVASARRPESNVEFVGVWDCEGRCGWTMQYHDGPQREPMGLNLVNLPLTKTWFVTDDGRLFESEAAAICKTRERRYAGKAAGYAPVKITLTK